MAHFDVARNAGQHFLVFSGFRYLIEDRFCHIHDRLHLSNIESQTGHRGEGAHDHTISSIEGKVR